MNFCKKIDCAGYSELKIKLKMQIEENKKNPIQKSSDYLLSLSKENSADELLYKESAGIIEGAKNIFFFGIGTSGILGEYGARYFSNLGYYSQYSKDPYFPFPNEEHRVGALIALSVSGETKSVIRQILGYKKMGYKVIGITANKSSSVAQLSDVTFHYDMTLEFVENVKERLVITPQVPVINIIEILGRYLFERKNKYLK